MMVIETSPLFMCNGDGCPKRGRCFRTEVEPSKRYQTKVKPDERQLWLESPPYRDGNCSWFMATEWKRERRDEAIA